MQNLNTCVKQLNSDVILAGSVDGAIQAKPNHKNPPVNNKPTYNNFF